MSYINHRGEKVLDIRSIRVVTGNECWVCNKLEVDLTTQFVDLCHGHTAEAIRVAPPKPKMGKELPTYDKLSTDLQKQLE